MLLMTITVPGCWLAVRPILETGSMHFQFRAADYDWMTKPFVLPSAFGSGLTYVSPINALVAHLLMPGVRTGFPAAGAQGAWPDINTLTIWFGVGSLVQVSRPPRNPRASPEPTANDLMASHSSLGRMVETLSGM